MVEIIERHQVRHRRVHHATRSFIVVEVVEDNVGIERVHF